MWIVNWPYKPFLCSQWTYISPLDEHVGDDRKHSCSSSRYVWRRIRIAMTFLWTSRHLHINRLYTYWWFAGVSGHAHRHWSGEFMTRAIAVRVLALAMMAISIGMAIYAAINFKRRGDMLQQKLDGPYDNRTLPIVLTMVLMTFLSVVWIGAIVSYREPWLL